MERCQFKRWGLPVYFMPKDNKWHLKKKALETDNTLWYPDIYISEIQIKGNSKLETPDSLERWLEFELLSLERCPYHSFLSMGYYCLAFNSLLQNFMTWYITKGRAKARLEHLLVYMKLKLQELVNQQGGSWNYFCLHCDLLCACQYCHL